MGSQVPQFYIALYYKQYRSYKVRRLVTCWSVATRLMIARRRHAPTNASSSASREAHQFDQLKLLQYLYCLSVRRTVANLVYRVNKYRRRGDCCGGLVLLGCPSPPVGRGGQVMVRACEGLVGARQSPGCWFFGRGRGGRHISEGLLMQLVAICATPPTPTPSRPGHVFTSRNPVYDIALSMYCS